MFDLMLNQIQEIDFVLIDSVGVEVAGLGAGFSIEIRKPGGVFVPGAGTKAEIGSGWYRYTFTAAEVNTVGPLAVRSWGIGTSQQNLFYKVQALVVGAIAFTYTVLDGAAQPIDGVEVWISVDLAGANVIWAGVTDALGVARDSQNILPYLDAGTYYFWSQKAGYTFVNPDTEVVS